MRWNDIKDLSASRFQRLTVIKRITFELMLVLVKEAKPVGGSVEVPNLRRLQIRD